MRWSLLMVAAALVLAACESATTGTSSPGFPETTAAISASTPTSMTALPNVTQSTPTTVIAPSTTVVTTTRPPDVAPPELTVTDPAAAGIVTERAYRFRGATEPGATVTAAGRYQVDVAADGTWAIVLMLNPGGNVATFVAADAEGNQTEVRHAVILHECADEPSIAIPSASADLSTATGDLDGDGAADTASVYRSAGSWFVGVELAYGWSTAIDITEQTTDWLEPASVHRIVDIGDPVILVIHGGTLIGFTAGPYGFSDCTLDPLRDVERGEILRLFHGVSLGGPQRFVCRADGFTQATLARRDPAEGGFVLERHDARYLVGQRAFEVSVHPLEVIGAGIPDSDPRFEELWSEALADFPQC